MSKIIDKIISSSAAPENKNVIWDNGKELKINRQGVWQSIGGSGGGGLTPITYSELKTLRDEGKLVPGTQYRITDYITTTAEINTKSAGYQFDVIVTADDESTLNEVARACLHEGDTYFSEAGAKLEAWQIWYCLDNDTDRFAWADATNGKGVIYRMIDEWNNDVPYDFKNVIYLLASTFECSMYGMSHTYTNNGDIITIGGVNYYGYKRTRTGSGPPPPTTPLYVTEIILSTSMTLYTIEGEVVSPYTSASVDSVTNSYGEFYTFGGISDSSIETYTTYSNIISPYFVQLIQTLNRNTFGNNCYNNSLGTNCYNNSFVDNGYNNSFGTNCYNNSFGNDCSSNSFGNDCYNNSFGNNCYNNSFGNRCYNNSFGKDCSSNSFVDNGYNNSFENNCYNNSFGNRCYNNSFGNGSSNNSFGTNCYNNSLGTNGYNNSFGTNCYNNSFGKDCSSNSFGNDCVINDFGNSCAFNSFGNGCSFNSFVDSHYKYNSFGDGCQYINLANNETASSSNYVQNYKLAQGLQGTSSSYITITTERNRAYETKVAKNSAGEVMIYCEADLIA